MEELSHLVSLSVGTTGGENHAEVFEGVTNYSKLLAKTQDYVSVSSQLVGSGEDDDEVEDAGCAEEHLRHDEDTLVKVREALVRGLMGTTDLDLIDQLVTNQINHLQNAGILFRERRDDEA
jgi:hypothetical protein